MSENDKAWEKLFRKYDILHRIEAEGVFHISAVQIKEFREPRLMAKFDHAVNLPELFSRNNLAILPVTRGDYVIFHFDAYHKLEAGNAPLTKLSLPCHIQSLDSNNVSSEAIALNCAFVSGIIADFVEDNDVVPTVSGRMGSGIFEFDIIDTKTRAFHQVNVNNSQIEIDAAYEGVSSLALIEAKIDLSDDFLIRQLYYPFRLWKSRVTKPVRTIFLVYSNGIYKLWEYKFEGLHNYNSLRLVKQRNYSIEDTAISVSDIQSVLKSSVIVGEPQVPFPQADKFERIVNLCELAGMQELKSTEITERYDFDARQTRYYADAARYLGLLDKRKESEMTIYSLSKTGQLILSLGLRQRQLEYCKRILAHEVFNTSLRLCLQRGTMPSSNEIISIMKQAELYHVESDSTYERRCSTIKGWINWILSLIDE